ncbi:hypothetical protein VT84_30615 [Gemmata sp. SH-PL17]|uniref:hypothetical protein n=1 Tax=Gemmata sp. SH-PL17 TaxID=1630693 RepID=UPI00078CD3C3|nr:hypothetical protein [Gemmata sp. SH-PL17]AMV28786.1 hypothetical protein VT84_30615 [Gemmata sp. SH-PL17]
MNFDGRVLVTALGLVAKSLVDLNGNVVLLARTFGGAPAGAAGAQGTTQPTTAPQQQQHTKPNSMSPGAPSGGGPNSNSAAYNFGSALRTLLQQVMKARSQAGGKRSGGGRREKSLLGRMFSRKTFNHFRKAARTAFRGGRGKGKGFLGAIGIGKRGGGIAQGARGAGAILGYIARLISMPFEKIIGLLNPMAVMAQAINSSASGFQVFGSAVKVLAATFAPLLLPLFANFAAGVIEMSDDLWNELLPVLEDFYDICQTVLIPAVQLMVDAFLFAVQAIKSATEIVADLTSGDSDRILNRLNPFSSEEEDEEAMMKRLGQGDFSGDRGSGGGANPWRDRARNDVFRELRQSMGAKASFSQIAQAGKNVQLAALNTSPFEARILERMDKAIGAMERVERNTQPKPVSRARPADDGGTF